MSNELIWEVALVALALAGGGILKGATGAGAPILAVPVLVLLFDVHFAILIMLVPNVLTNLWQGWKFRSHLPERNFILPLLGGGLIGIVIGTYTLASLSSDTLSILVALAVFGYIALRVARPSWYLPMPLAKTLAFPSGILSGFLQGASGLSAPSSITFLNAMRLPRPVFIATISTFFCVFTAAQIVSLAVGGLLETQALIYSTFALIPITLAMPLGARLAKALSPETFDRIILGLLAVVAIRLLFNALL
jgi:uncharacterized protein